jgi:hypothetical protein
MRRRGWYSALIRAVSNSSNNHTMHPRTKRQLLQITKPLARLIAGYGVLILFFILAIIALITLP